MGMMGKLKNILFTEEEETEEIPVIQESPAPEVHEENNSLEEEIARFKNFNYEEKFNPEPVQEEKPMMVEEPVKKEERSPFQSFDEEEFDRIAAINKNRLLERDRKLREEKERKREQLEHHEVKVVEKEQPKFVPSPVISPVYGILDKNYTKDDILPRASSDGTLPKIMDVDLVRKKAFGTLETLEKNITNDLDDIKITSFEDEVDNDDVIISGRVQKIEVEDTKPLPIVEEEVEDTKPLPIVEEEEEKTKPIPKTRAKKEEVEVQDVIDEVQKEDEKIDNDLFELIDSMYKDEEGE